MIKTMPESGRPWPELQDGVEAEVGGTEQARDAEHDGEVERRADPLAEAELEAADQEAPAEAVASARLSVRGFRFAHESGFDPAAVRPFPAAATGRWRATLHQFRRESSAAAVYSDVRAEPMEQSSVVRRMATCSATDLQRRAA